MPITTDLDRFRLELGDTPAAYGLAAPRPNPDAEFQAVALFNDDESNYFIARRPGNVLLAVADACDALATRFARAVDFSEDGQSFKPSSRSAMYATMGRRLRERAVVDGTDAAPGGLPLWAFPAVVPLDF